MSKCCKFTNSKVFFWQKPLKASASEPRLASSPASACQNKLPPFWGLQRNKNGEFLDVNPHNPQFYSKVIMICIMNIHAHSFLSLVFDEASTCFISTSPSVATPLRDAAIARSISNTCKASNIALDFQGAKVTMSCLKIGGWWWPRCCFIESFDKSLGHAL